MSERVRGRYEVFTPEQIERMTPEAAKVAVDALQQMYIPRMSYWAAVEGALISFTLGAILYQAMGVTGIYLAMGTAGLVKRFTDALFAHTKHTLKDLFMRKKETPPDEDNSPPDQPASS